MKRALLLVVAVSLAACAGTMGQAAEEVPQQEDGQLFLDAAEPVDFRRLQALLPETAVGLPRTGVEGDREGFGGMYVAYAEGTYEGPAGTDGAAPRVDLKVTDLVGTDMAAMLTDAWTTTSVDREGDHDYERTVRVYGNPGYETYDTLARRGAFQVMVAGRFLVEAGGSGVGDDQLREVLRAAGFRALEGLRDEGR